MHKNLLIRTMHADDISGAALVHREAFVRQIKSEAWIQCCMAAHPRTLSYVAEREGQIVGYIFWTQKAGFRPEVVLELEQLAVLPAFHGQGIATALIKETLAETTAFIQSDGARIKHIMVTTRVDNHAQALYRKTLGAEVEATIRNLYSADEVIMIARDIS